MGWASRRRVLIIFIVVAVILAVLAFVLEAFLYQTPSCADNQQNQGETGVDCGGPCAYVCTAQEAAPVVRFTKLLTPSASRVDLIAYVDNANANAGAQSVPYTILLYAADHTVLKKSMGTIDLPPASTVPVFIPGFFSGSIEGAQAFLTIDDQNIKWLSISEVRKPSVGSPTVSGTLTAPQIHTALANSGTTPILNTKVIAVVFDAFGNIVAASQTVVPRIPGGGTAEAIFVWNSAFPHSPTRIEVTPLVTL